MKNTKRYFSLKKQIKIILNYRSYSFLKKCKSVVINNYNNAFTLYYSSSNYLFSFERIIFSRKSISNSGLILTQQLPHFFFLSYHMVDYILGNKNDLYKPFLLHQVPRSTSFYILQFCLN